LESAPELKLEPNEEPVVGALIQEKYRLILRLAASPNHIVFRAVDETIQKEVVLKFLAKEVVATPDRRARLEREGLLLERVATCPFIVALKANESRQRWPFLVLEYVEGESLAARFRREGPLPVDECARIVLAVAKALESMRQNRIVHRDVKPDNVLLRRNGEVCVIDLSVARDLGDAASITEDGVFLGTPGYASPEQHRRDPGVDWRSDVYNLGASPQPNVGRGSAILVQQRKIMAISATTL
jgi:serine/threonine protein kinase